MKQLSSSGLNDLLKLFEAVPALEHEIYSDTKIGDYNLLRYLGEGQWASNTTISCGCVTCAHPSSAPLSPTNYKGEFASVQACSRPSDPKRYAVKHIIKERLICATDIKRTMRRVTRVAAEIQAMQSLSSE
jgi:hypothetical protein